MTLRARLLLALAYVLVLAIVALGVPLALSLRDRVDAEIRSQARNQADVVAATIGDDLDETERLGPIAQTAARAVRGRVIVVDGNGRLLADSAATDALGTDFRGRPEIAGALRGDAIQDQRRSDTLDEELLVTAVPILEDGAPIGAVRVTQSVEAVGRAVNRTTGGLALLGGVVLFLGLAAGALIARWVAEPLRRLEAAAQRVGSGDLDARAPVEGSAEQQSLARSVNQMTERLSRLLRSQQDFVADASHQLRTPITGMRLRLEEAHAATDSPDAREEIVAAMADLDRLSATIDELLVLSQAGEADSQPEDVDLRDIAERAVERWRAPAAKRGHEITLLPTNGATPLHAAPADLDRALDSLIENAVRYSPDGTPVEVAVTAHGIDVLDRGPGVEPGAEEELFARFHRGDAGRAGPPGTGLGLPIARELMRRWGGDATITNRRGGGAQATLHAHKEDPR